MRLDKQIQRKHTQKQIKKKCKKVFLGFWNNRSEKNTVKDRYKSNMIKDRPGAVDFTSGFSRENSTRWVNKLLLGIDRRTNNYDDTQGNDHVYRHHVQD